MYRVSQKALRVVAFAGVIAGAAALSGCSSLGGLVDNSTTGSTAQNASSSSLQPMPSTLLPESTRVAAGPFIPPADIGGPGASPSSFAGSGGGDSGSVLSDDLPELTASTSKEDLTPMPAQSSSALVEVAATPSTLGASSPALVSIPKDAYVHVIESGESLYTIARRYDVTAQAIIQANGFSSPDKIYVGQRIIIPGRADLLAAKGPGKVAVAAEAADEPIEVASIETNPAPALPAKREVVAPVEEKTEVANVENVPLQQPSVEPVLSGAGKFRWPVSGRVITDFSNSKQTGINIEAPEGAAIRAAENGQVIYVGNGVEGYGNLILIRHPNGFVSAYAHLKDTKVSKGDIVSRGDQIGTAGMTGSVSRPQLHFELRKGATPVDPVPLLAS